MTCNLNTKVIEQMTLRELTHRMMEVVFLRRRCHMSDTAKELGISMQTLRVHMDSADYQKVPYEPMADAYMFADLLREYLQVLPEDQTALVLKRVNAPLTRTYRREIRHPGLSEWLENGDRSKSSLCMATLMSKTPHSFSPVRTMPYDCPRDVRDFERCVTLLNRVPSLAGELDLMRDVNPQWATLVDHWDELKALLKHRKHCNDRIQELLEEIE